MSVYIKGMKMPTNCCQCPVNMEICKRGYKYLLEHPELYDKRADDCPIVPVLSHGRLIDADALDDILADQSEDAYNRTHAPRSWERALSAMRDYLDDAPTIIPASEDDTDDDVPICTKASPASRGIYKSEEGE